MAGAARAKACRGGGKRAAKSCSCRQKEAVYLGSATAWEERRSRYAKYALPAEHRAAIHPARNTRGTFTL